MLGQATIIEDTRGRALPAPIGDVGVIGVGIVSGGCRAMLGQVSPPRKVLAELTLKVSEGRLQTQTEQSWA